MGEAPTNREIRSISRSKTMLTIITGRQEAVGVVSSYVFLRTYYVWLEKSKGQMFNMLLLISEMFYYLKK